nr:replication-relaxation family protein [Bacillus sp. AFS041924]
MKTLKFATRRQLQGVHSLQGIRNAQRILKTMATDELLLVTRFSNENIYYLSKSGAERIGVKPIKKSIQIDHHLLRNEAWLMLGMPNWKVESPIKFALEGKEHNIIPDALMITDTLYCIEIDRKQNMIKNRKKFETYGKLNFIYQAQKGKKIIIKFFTTLKSRKKLIEKLAEEFQVVCEVYVIEDI